MEVVNEGRERNMLLEEMRTQVILNIVVGMYHEWGYILPMFIFRECVINLVKVSATSGADF